jgi:hypothetical protein
MTAAGAQDEIGVDGRESDDGRPVGDQPDNDTRHLAGIVNGDCAP